ncbi:MAG: deoxyribonuclease IV [Actinomycetes bacterium]
MPVRRPSPIGAHVPVAGGLATGGLRYADQVGAEVIQVFIGSPRTWATPTGNPWEDEQLRTEAARRRLPVFVHAPYLINLGTPSPATLARSVASLHHCLRRSTVIGATGVVLHTGSAVHPGTRDRAMHQVREALLPLLAELDEVAETAGSAPWLLLEPSAGTANALASRVEDLGPYLEALDHHPRLGVCLDTCHAFAAGHDLAAPGGLKRTLDTLVKSVGKGRLRLVHANDSKDPAGSGRDRHASIGQGRIGAEAFAELFRHPGTSGVPIVVETPGQAGDHRRDIELLAELRAR